jgi:hypothetical protein
MGSKITLLTFLISLSISGFSQTRSGFIYNYFSEYDITASINCRPFIKGKTLVQNIVTDTAYINAVGKNEKQWLTIVDSALSGIDTTIVLNDDTSAAYIYTYNQCLIQDDTAYFLLDCLERTPSGVSLNNPVNLLFVKMDKNYNFSSAKYLFEEDSLGVLLGRSYVNMKFDSNRNHFELMLMQRDTISLHHDPILVRFNRQGDLKYYKKWDYTALTQKLMYIRDFYNRGNGEYLLVQDITTDIYVIADTGKTEINSTYYKPEIRGLVSIVEKDNSLVLFGKSDGHKILSFKEGKLQYTILELDKNTLQEQKRLSYKVKDTLKYEIEGQLLPDNIVALSDGSYLYTSREPHYFNGRNNSMVVSSIYRVDSSMNLIWSYKMADTLYNEIMGGSTIQAIPGNQNEVLWHCGVYVAQGNNTPTSTWLMKFNIDGSDLGVGLTEEEQIPEFSLYPNPASDVAFVLLPFVPSGASTIEIYDLKGQLVNSQTFTERDNLLKVGLNVPGGSYLLKVISGGYEATKQLVVE